MSPRTGRPKLENPRNVNLNIRITEQEAQDIQECADAMNTTRTNAIMEGIRLVKENLKNKK